MMKIVKDINSLRTEIQQWRQQSKTVALVPTMGNLHAGHLKLVEEAKKKADKVVVSIFVNPTQFGEGEDFESYPRTEKQDEQNLIKVFADLLFLPPIEEMYPLGFITTVTVNHLSTLHCGANRPGHFDGVATVVVKLFNMVQPDIAIFGEKDFQQLMIIKRIVKDLNLPIQVLGVSIVREPNGLAMSSRNTYLSTEQRAIASLLYQSLVEAKQQVLAETVLLRSIEKKQTQILQRKGFDVDYFHICQEDTLLPAQQEDHGIVILVAAKLGKPRLIDNICFQK